MSASTGFTTEQLRQIKEEQNKPYLDEKGIREAIGAALALLTLAQRQDATLGDVYSALGLAGQYVDDADRSFCHLYDNDLPSKSAEKTLKELVCSSSVSNLSQVAASGELNIERLKLAAIADALELSGGKQRGPQGAAVLLGVSESTLVKWVRKARSRTPRQVMVADVKAAATGK